MLRGKQGGAATGGGVVTGGGAATGGGAVTGGGVVTGGGAVTGGGVVTGDGIVLVWAFITISVVAGSGLLGIVLQEPALDRTFIVYFPGDL
jgi:hypothetical protein